MCIDIQIGEGVDWKFGLITRYVERISKYKYVIHDTSHGWCIAKINKKTLDKITKGEMELFQLEWI